MATKNGEFMIVVVSIESWDRHPVPIKLWSLYRQYILLSNLIRLRDNRLISEPLKTNFPGTIGSIHKTHRTLLDSSPRTLPCASSTPSKY
ncbi:hypothetical protein TNCV_4138481 [Trichonephila clavipes]|nr:hypothetical protein TNCV_4138481 [Trichonephila clavipes]